MEKDNLKVIWSLVDLVMLIKSKDIKEDFLLSVLIYVYSVSIDSILCKKWRG